MKKLFLGIGISIISIFGLTEKSVAQVYEQGNILAGVQVGLVPTFASISGFGITQKSTLPPISAFGEYGVTESISAGVFAGYSSASYDYGFGSGMDYTYTIFGARGSYHFIPDNEKFDWYAGVLVGYNNVSATATGTGSSLFTMTAAASAILYGGYLGGRYYLTDNIALHSELGYGIAVINFGATVKF